MEAMTSDNLKVSLLCVAGSRAYNFATPESDYDQRGFGVQTHLFRMLGLSRPKDEESSVVDGYLWDIAKFTRLAVKSNTNALDTLFAEEFNVLEMDEVGKLYREHKKSFLSTHSLYNVLKGYALSEFDLATGKKKQGDMGAKRRVQVEKYGYSLKNAHHCIRLLLSGINSFKTGEFKTYWKNDDPEWKILMGLKLGEYSVNEFENFHVAAMEEFEYQSKGSVIPQEPDFDFVNELLCYVLGKEVVKMFPTLKLAQQK